MNKTFKRIAAAVMAAVIAIGVPQKLSASVVDSGSCGDNVTWSYDSSGKLTISGSGAMEDYIAGGMPWNSYKGDITTVVIEPGITVIGQSAFESHSKLANVTIPDTVTIIGKEAFRQCNSLTSINIPNSVTTIKDSALSYCKNLASVTIPASVTSIEKNAFLCCYGMTAIILKGKTPPTISTNVFYNGGMIDKLTADIYVPCGSVEEYRTYLYNRDNYAKDKINPSHSPDKRTAAKAATCTKSGNIEYWTCSCGSKKFSDAAGTTEITNVTTTALGHDYGADWSKDGTNHWHACTRCGDKKDSAKHSWGTGTVTTAAACTTDGIMTYACTVCGQTKTEAIAAAGHNFGSEWEKNDTQHWHKCTRCDETEGTADHDWDEGVVTTEATEEHAGVRTFTCSDCGAVKTSVIAQLPHTHDLEHYDAVSATCTDDGNVEYWHCTKCGCDYGDEGAANQLADVVVYATGHDWGAWTVIKAPSINEAGTARRICANDNSHIDTNDNVPAVTDNIWSKTGHKDPSLNEKGEDVYTSSEFGEIKIAIPELSDTSVWTKDETDDRHLEPTEETEGKYVYKSESFGEIEVILPKKDHVHTLEHIPEKPATEEAEGVKEHWHCTTCGKDFLDENGETEASESDLRIPVLTVQTETSGRAPQTTLDMPRDEVFEAVAEVKDVAEGADIKITLKIEDADEKAPEEDKQAAEAAANSKKLKMGQYIDISLIMETTVGNASPTATAVTETQKPLTIVITIPSELLGKASYSVIRIHNGESTILTDQDNDANTITIKTDKFSTYALAYSETIDEAASDGTNTEENTLTPPINVSADSSESATPNADSSNPTVPDVGGTGANDSTQAGGENNSSSNGDKPNNSEKNPSTGVSASVIPAAVSLIVLMLTAKRKKK